MLRSLFVSFLLLALFSTASAQKYGHINFANLLTEMPGMTKAEAGLQEYNDQLIKAGETKVETFNKNVADLQAKVGDLAPVELQKQQRLLAQEQQSIAQYEQEMGVKLEKKRRELLGPFISEAKKVIQTVAKEKGYQLVFDTSIFNAVLFAEDSVDLMPLVKAKLGI